MGQAFRPPRPAPERQRWLPPVGHERQGAQLRPAARAERASGDAELQGEGPVVGHAQLRRPWVRVRVRPVGIDLRVDQFLITNWGPERIVIKGMWGIVHGQVKYVRKGNKLSTIKNYNTGSI